MRGFHERSPKTTAGAGRLFWPPTRPFRIGRRGNASSLSQCIRPKICSVFPEHVFPRRQKPLLGTPTRTPRLFSSHPCAGKHKPLLGTPTPNTMVFFRVLLRKQEPLLGTPTRTPRLLIGYVLPENKALARNADPRRISCVSQLYHPFGW